MYLDCLDIVILILPGFARQYSKLRFIRSASWKPVGLNDSKDTKSILDVMAWIIWHILMRKI